MVEFLTLIFSFQMNLNIRIRKKYRPKRSEFNEAINHLGLAQFYFQNRIKIRFRASTPSS